MAKGKQMSSNAKVKVWSVSGARKVAREQYDLQFLNWLEGREFRWLVNPYNEHKVELVGSDGRVLLQVMSWGEMASSGDIDRFAADWIREYPFAVLTRKWLESGDCIKGKRRFRTASTMHRYIDRAYDRGLAVTYHD